MIRPPLPTSLDAYLSLCRTGRSFPESSRRIITVEDGARTIQIDKYAQSGVSHFYTKNQPLARALNSQWVTSTEALPDRLRHYYALGNVWGVSGYTLPDREYGPEANMLLALFSRLRELRKQPTLVVDGGVSNGVLGLSGALAERFQIASLGYVPVTKLDSMGPRTYIVAHKKSYRDREVLVGTTPDVLVCVGGADGTIRECETALKSGSVVVMMAPRDDYDDQSLPGSHQTNAVIRKYAANFFTCVNTVQVAQIVPSVLQRVHWTNKYNRAQRLETLRTELA